MGAIHISFMQLYKCTVSTCIHSYTVGHHSEDGQYSFLDKTITSHSRAQRTIKSSPVPTESPSPITQRCDIYLLWLLEFLQVLALNLTSFSWTSGLFWQQENGRKLNKSLHHPRFNHVLQIANSGRETFLVLCFEFWDQILYFQDFQWLPTSLFQYQAPSE